ncbi:hypothetical protein [Phenylobacterium sp.]|uniref:hypothetical protein n=1 Tax=Phenylobacterium sp. TaxID=1871053 RepID=UPI002731199F|nr:hypothetical protein [Phenylobacterium sp.]MDP1618652.1 hypothetical protein [Phenylobacterium sp.]MDP1987204.1 hypothetical protein [Phenylobacterium sp.]
MGRKSLARHPILTLLALGVGAIAALPAAAQVTPSDVRDLVGVRGASGESELAARGYVQTGGQTGDDRQWTYWWNERRGVCLSVATAEGRYDSIVSTPAADCQRGGGGGGGSAFRPPEFGYGDSYDRGGYQEHIALICYGEGHRTGTQMKSGYTWDSDKNKYVAQTGYELTNEEYDTSVTIEIDGARGRIRPAKNMIPLIHSSSDGGWYDIANLSISRDVINGSFTFNGANRPKITIDRRAGRISLDGLTQFSGSCTPLDGDRMF